MSGFCSYRASATLESLPIQTSSLNNCSPLVRITCGANDLHAACASGPHVPASSLTLPDGRLNVGCHLPLLARRYRYLSVLGEGVSAQVLLVEDTLHPGRLVTVKAMRRQYKQAGQREARALRFLHSRRQGGTPAPGIVRLLGTFMLGAHFCMVMVR